MRTSGSGEEVWNEQCAHIARSVAIGEISRNHPEEEHWHTLVPSQDYLYGIQMVLLVGPSCWGVKVT